MHIIHIITTLDIGGAEKQLVVLAKHQLQSSTSCEVLYLKSSAPLKHDLEIVGVRVRKLTLGTFLRLSIDNRLQKILDRGNSKNLLHAHLPRAEILGILLSIFAGIPLVVSKHNSEKMWPKGPKFISYILSRVVHSRSSFIVCITRSVKLFLEQIEELPSNSKKVEVIHYGFYGSVERDLELFKQPIKVLTLARLEPQKDLSTLVRACEKLQVEGVQVQVRIRGEGSLKNEITREISARGIRNVEILPPVADVEKEYLWADLLVLPSRYEGFGLVLLEAMSYNIMILSTNSPAAEEILGTGSALLFPIGNADALAHKIETLSRSAIHRMENQRLVKVRSKSFDLENQLTKTKTLYERILN